MPFIFYNGVMKAVKMGSKRMGKRFAVVGENEKYLAPVEWMV